MAPGARGPPRRDKAAGHAATGITGTSGGVAGSGGISGWKPGGARREFCRKPRFGAMSPACPVRLRVAGPSDCSRLEAPAPVARYKVPPRPSRAPKLAGTQPPVRPRQAPIRRYEPRYIRPKLRFPDTKFRSAAASSAPPLYTAGPRPPSLTSRQPPPLLWDSRDPPETPRTPQPPWPLSPPPFEAPGAAAAVKSNDVTGIPSAAAAAAAAAARARINRNGTDRGSRNGLNPPGRRLRAPAPAPGVPRDPRDPPALGNTTGPPRDPRDLRESPQSISRDSRDRPVTPRNSRETPGIAPGTSVSLRNLCRDPRDILVTTRDPHQDRPGVDQSPYGGPPYRNDGNFPPGCSRD
ncbi:uncharacterized protein [Aphelocoma coerulescens]|uniref:uncharacterized protein n=1 Tax=Aphelocoma coerulescens TaxID=39617 RepID=UPI003604EDCB